MVNQIQELNRACYKQQLQLLSLIDYANALSNDNQRAVKKWLCVDEKKLLAGSYLFFMKLLFALRDSTKLFVIMTKEIEAKNFEVSHLTFIAEDLIKLFFADFAVSEHSIVRILKIFEELLKTCFTESADTWYSYRLFINALLEAYFDRIENREYLKLIFRKGLNGISLSVKDIETEEGLPEPNFNYVAISSDKKTSEEENKSLAEEVNYKRPKKIDSVTNKEELKGMIDYSNEVYDICNKFVVNIATKLMYMPLSIRYLCKLIQRLCNEIFKENAISFLYKALADLLYHCWWERVLLNPSAYDIIKISLGRNSSVKKKIASASELLRRVLYDDKLPETINYSSKLAEFIKDHNEILEAYLSELLNIELPALEISKLEEDSLDIASTCISIKTMKTVYEVLNAKKEEVKEAGEIYEKYLSRINFIIENSSKSCSLFTATESDFELDADPLYDLKEKFIDSSHYILFQNILVKEENKIKILTEPWELLLDKLLPKIDSTCCYNNSHNGINFISFLKQIAEYPNGFLVNKANSEAIKVLAISLLDYFEGRDEKAIKKSIEHLKEGYANTSQLFLEKQQRVKYNLREAVTALKNRLRFLQEITVKIREEVVCRLHAERFIKSLSIKFNMRKELNTKEQQMTKIKEEWKLSLHKITSESTTNKEIAEVLLLGHKKKLNKTKRTNANKKIKK